MKTYIATYSYRSGRIEFTGTVPELVEKFSYTLLAGNSWDPTIKTNPTTAKGLENALNKSASVRRCYYDSYYIREAK